MADLRWLERTVNTQGRPCPVRLAEPCPGNRQGCAWWLDEILEQGPRGETVQMGGCGLMWLYAIQHEIRSEAIRTQAGLDKAASTISQAGQSVVVALGGYAAPALAGQVRE